MPASSLVERACAQALADGIHSYQHVKRITHKLVGDALAAIDAAGAEPVHAEHARRFKHSRLEERLTPVDFDWRFNPKLPRQACFALHTLKFIGEGANALIIGKPGTGKSHVAKAVAYQSTLQGHEDWGQVPR